MRIEDDLVRYEVASEIPHNGCRAIGWMSQQMMILQDNGTRRSEATSLTESSSAWAGLHSMSYN